MFRRAARSTFGHHQKPNAKNPARMNKKQTVDILPRKMDGFLGCEVGCGMMLGNYYDRKVVFHPVNQHHHQRFSWLSYWLS